MAKRQSKSVEHESAKEEVCLKYPSSTYCFKISYNHYFNMNTDFIMQQIEGISIQQA